MRTIRDLLERLIFDNDLTLVTDEQRVYVSSFQDHPVIAERREMEIRGHYSLHWYASVPALFTRSGLDAPS